MEYFREQYRRELKFQEVKSNQYTLKGFLWFLIGITFIWILTVTGFFEVDKALTTIAFVSTIVLFLPALYICLRSDLSKSWIKYFFLTLICIVSAVIVSVLSFHAVLLYVVPLLFAVQYRKRGVIWFVYVVNTVTMLISSLVSFYYGLCDLNLLLESQHIRSWYLDMMSEGALNIPLNENPVFIIIVFEVFPRSIILFVFSIMMHYAVVSRKEDAFRIAKLTYLKGTDFKTGVFNINKYEEMVAEYYPKIEQIAVVFWDINNLKYINDAYGHAMGDRAIEQLSSALGVYCNDRCRVYRIGGDEFLMVLDNPERNEAESMIKLIKEKLETASDKIKVSVAAGVAFGSGKEILEIAEAADAHMYENKKSEKESGC